MAGEITAIFTILCIPAIWLVYRLLKIGSRPKNYPPGPPTIPIFGNIFQMPTQDAHVQFQKWAREYGPVYSLILGTKVMIVLSSDQAIKDLLDRRSAIYSSRPDLYIAQTVASGGQRMLITPYGAKYRMQRKLCQNALSLKKSISYTPYQDIETKQLLYDVMQDPLNDGSRLFEHLRRFSSSVATSIVYGFRWNTFTDADLTLFFRNMDHFTSIMNAGGSALADSFPIFRLLPSFIYPIKKRAQQHHESERNLFSRWYTSVRDAHVQKLPTARACVCADILESQQQEGFDDDFGIYLACALFEAGSETTGSELYGFTQAMLLYPSVQAKAQEEIDRVVGGEKRWPDMDDIKALPYIRALVKETLRWMPTLILGAAPHALMQDDVYMGYHLPAGAMIMKNVWTIHRDPSRYAEPETFRPERYLGDETSSAESCALADVSKRDHFGFGAGRRVCPGTHLSDRTLFLLMARWLWAFHVKSIDDGGLPKQDEFHQGMAAYPRPFKCAIVSRSEKRKEMVVREWEEARNLLDDEGQFLKNPI